MQEFFISFQIHQPLLLKTPSGGSMGDFFAETKVKNFFLVFNFLIIVAKRIENFFGLNVSEYRHEKIKNISGIVLWITN